ncbi:hypothetical protein LTR80_012327, partial [Exophiala xenobiotica]
MKHRIEITDNKAEADVKQVLNVTLSTTVKTRLKEDKDKLINKSLDWILRDPQYLRWQDGPDVGLLWINGGAGNGRRRYRLVSWKNWKSGRDKQRRRR